VGAKLTDDERRKQRVNRIRRRTTRALEDLGIELPSEVGDDHEAIAIGERNVARLRQIGNEMGRKTPPTAPTPERVRHAPEPPREIEVRTEGPRAHRFEWALEGMRDKLPSRSYEAAVRLRDVFLATEPASRVADPTAVGGSSDPAKRLPITERQELAGRQLHWVLGRLDQPFRSVIRNFVLEQPKQGAERCLNVEEWGAKVAKYQGAQGRAAGVTSIIFACARLATLWEVHDAWQREQCAKTDRMMRTEIGRRAAQGGWIIALWSFCHTHGRLPQVQGEMDQCRAAHDTDVKRLRLAPPMELERWQRRRERLIAVAFVGSDDNRVRVA